MKRLFQTVTLLGTLFLGQQVLAQDREQKDPFYVQRFSRDNPLYFPYQDNRVQLLRLNFNYPHSPETRIAQDPGNVRELENFLSRHTPLLGTFLEADNEPFQFKSLNFTFGSSARKNSLLGYFPGSLATLTGNPLPTIHISRKETSAGNRLIRGFVRIMNK